MDILRKDQLEASLHEEKKLIEDGRLKDDSPLDVSERFDKLCEACRRGDLKTCQETIAEGVKVNACDRFDYTPLILASLCGHYEVVHFLLESGALCERDTFQGERCLYNALNDRIRNLLLSYDYSKSTDPLQPFASHITSLLLRDTPKTSDIVVLAAGETFHLHKLILSSRSPYFSRKLSISPEAMTWKLPSTIPPQAFGIAMRHVYLGEIPVEIGEGLGTGTWYSEDEVIEGIDKISKQLEIRNLWNSILEDGDRRLARQRRAEEVEKGRNQLDIWFRGNVLKYKVSINTSQANNIRWDRDNAIFADVLLRADEAGEDPDDESSPDLATLTSLNGIPVGPVSHLSRPSLYSRPPRKSILFPVHRAMLIRSEFFLTMFSSAFREAQPTAHLQIIPIDCSPEVLELVLSFLYTEKSDIPLNLAVDVLFAADLLLLDKLKLQAATVISTHGNGSFSGQRNMVGTQLEEESINVYDVVRAGWLTRVPRLEEFGARYFAYRLEHYIEEEEFAELIQESANQIRSRQETDSIELLDEIRYYLSQRFRLRFEDSGIEELMDESPASAPPPAPTNHDPRPTPNEEDEAIDMRSTLDHNSQQPATANPTTTPPTTSEHQPIGGVVRTLDGDLAGDEFASDAINYQILLGRIDVLLERLRLDA